jgi:hypothetical protein
MNKRENRRRLGLPWMALVTIHRIVIRIVISTSCNAQRSITDRGGRRGRTRERGVVRTGVDCGSRVRVDYRIGGIRDGL